MSLILKGIDLPKDIDELRLIINGMSIAIEPTEAIQIPTPHGRLIDEKEVIARAENESNGIVMSGEHLGIVTEWITDKCDAILEAEEE